MKVGAMTVWVMRVDGGDSWLDYSWGSIWQVDLIMVFIFIFLLPQQSPASLSPPCSLITLTVIA